MRIAFAALLLLGACAEYEAARAAVHKAAEFANDRTMDDSVLVLCNNVYSAEQRFRVRHSIAAETFTAFCGRDRQVVR